VNTLCIRPEALNNASKTLNNAANALCTDSGTFTIAANTLSITPDTLCIASNTLNIGWDTLNMERDTLNIALNTFNNPPRLSAFRLFQRLGRLPLFLFGHGETRIYTDGSALPVFIRVSSVPIRG
jgi:hypothetical protein